MPITRMFVALRLISLNGVLIVLALTGLSHPCSRRWHESALARERSA